MRLVLRDRNRAGLQPRLEGRERARERAALEHVRHARDRLDTTCQAIRWSESLIA